jgi:hypothetical protein
MSFILDNNSNPFLICFACGRQHNTNEELTACINRHVEQMNSILGRRHATRKPEAEVVQEVDFSD